ncbi:MAG: glycosyl transferase [Deltaproteobacteria bacterium]|nr:glycosyl transferase [Deltaproteobacteria bacterium]
MGDFFQNGTISTLHQIGKVELEALEERITRYAVWRPISLVLPSLYSELEGQALSRIVNILIDVGYIDRIVVGLDSANQDEFKQALDFFAILPQNTKVIWNDGPRMQGIYSKLNKEGLISVSAGKGRNVWMCLGYVLACRDTDVIALHDCDILTYERSLLARLVYPVVDPNMEYEYAKGYYARVTDRLHGRVTRLFVTPLIRALKKIVGFLPYLNYLDSFRYPLAGEFAMKDGLAMVNKMPANWGLEIGLLGEVYRNCTQRRVCQVDLSVDYEHKHQELSDGDPTKGLLKMSIDIAISLFSTLASEGVAFSDGMFRALKVTYQRIAQDAVRLYEDDADINGLFFDRHSEVKAVDTFTKGLDIAGQAFLKDPLGSPFISSWARVTAAIPSIFDEIREVVEKDNKTTS